VTRPAGTVLEMQLQLRSFVPLALLLSVRLFERRSAGRSIYMGRGELCCNGFRSRLFIWTIPM